MMRVFSALGILLILQIRKYKKLTILSTETMLSAYFVGFRWAYLNCSIVPQRCKETSLFKIWKEGERFKGVDSWHINF